MSTNVFNITGSVSVLTDRAVRNLLNFRNQVVSTTRVAQQSFAGLDRALGSFSGFFTGLQFERLAKSMLQASMRTETFRVQLGLVVKDLTKIEKLNSFIEDYEAKTPFDLPELQKATILFSKLAVIRGEDTKKVEQYIKLAGEYATLYDKPLQKAVEGIFKTMSGSASGLTILRNNFGISVKQLKELGVQFDNSGRIKNFSAQIGTIENALQRIIMGVTGMKLAEAASQTLAGRISTLGSEVYRTARVFGDALNPVAQTAVDIMIALNKYLQSMDPYWVNVIALATGFAAALGALIVTFGPVVFFTSQLVRSMVALRAGFTSTSVAGQLLVRLFTPIPVLLSGINGALVAFGGWIVSIARAGSAGQAFFVALQGIVNAFTPTVAAIRAGTIGVGALTGAMSSGALQAIAYRAGLLGVGLAALDALTKLKQLTDWQNKANKEDADLQKQVNAKKTGEALRLAEKVATVRAPRVAENMRRLPGSIGPTDERYKTFLFDEGYSSEEIKKQKAALDAELNAARKTVNSLKQASLQQRELDQETVVDFAAANKRKLMVKGLRPEGFLERSQAGLASGLRRAARSYMGESITEEQYQAALARLQKNEYTKGPSSAQNLNLKRLQDAQKVLDEQLKGAEMQERLGRGRRDADTVREDARALDENYKREVRTAEDAFNKILQLRKEGLTKEGKVKESFLELDKNLAEKQKEYFGQAVKDRIQKLKDGYELDVAQEGESAVRKRKFIDDQLAAIEELGKKNGLITKEVNRQQTQLYEEQEKLTYENRRANHELYVETIRQTHGELAAKKLVMADELREKRRVVTDQVTLAKWKAQQELLIEQEKARQIAEVQDDLNDQIASAAKAKADQARSKAEYDLSRGSGDYGAVRDARKAADKQEDKDAKDAMDKEIRQAKEAAQGDAVRTAQLEKLTAAIKARYKAEAEGRAEARRQRDEDFDREETQKKKEDAITKAQDANKARDFELENLRKRQDEGENVDFRIREVLRDKYRQQVEIIKAQAEAAKIGKDAADQAEIDRDMKNQILDLTRQATQEMEAQLDLAKNKKKIEQPDYFKTGPMTYEESVEQDKQRSAAGRARYEKMVEAERKRTGRSGARGAAGELGVDQATQDTMFNPQPVKFEPLKAMIEVMLKYPDGTTQTARKETSTDVKNKDQTSTSNTRGRPKT